MDFKALAEDAAARGKILAAGKKRARELYEYNLKLIAEGGGKELISVSLVGASFFLNAWLKNYADATGASIEDTSRILLSELRKLSEITDENA